MSSHSHFDRAKYNQQECLMARRAEREREAIEVEREELEGRLAELEAEATGDSCQKENQREVLKGEIAAARYEVEHLEQALADAVAADQAAEDKVRLATQSFQAGAITRTTPCPSSSAPNADLSGPGFQQDPTTQRQAVRLRILGVVIPELTARRAALEADEGRYRAERARLEAYKGFPSRHLQDKQKALGRLTRRRAKMEAAIDEAKADWPDGKEVEAARAAVASEAAKVAEMEGEVEELRLQVRRERGEVVVSQDELAEDGGATDEKHRELAARLATAQGRQDRREALLARLRRAGASLAAASEQTQVELAEAGAAADAGEKRRAAAEMECGKLREQVKDWPTSRRGPSPTASAAVAVAQVAVKQLQANINAATVRRAQLQSESAELVLQVPSDVGKQLTAAKAEIVSLEAELNRPAGAEVREVQGVTSDGVDDKLKEVGEEVGRLVRDEAQGWWATVRGLENKVAAEREAAAKRAAAKAKVVRPAPATCSRSGARTTPATSESTAVPAARSRAAAKRLGWAIAQLEDMLEEAEAAARRQRGRHADLLVRALDAQLTA